MDACAVEFRVRSAESYRLQHNHFIKFAKEGKGCQGWQKNIHSLNPRTPLRPPATEPEARPLRAGFLARMPRISRRKTIGFGVVLLFLIGNGIVLRIWLPALSKPEPLSSAKMLQALAALDRHSLNDAKHLAMALKQSAQLDSSDRGGPLFVLGAVEAETAEQLPEAEQQAAFQSAARLLEDARQRGFPEGRQAQGMLLLGKCLYLSGDYVASRAALEEALQDNRQTDPAAFAMLADAYFRGADPNDRKARDYIDRYLTTPSLSADMRDSAELLKARILDRLQDLSGSEKALAQIPESAACYPSVLEFAAQQLIRQARAPSNPASKQLYQQAIEKLQAAQGRSSTGSVLVLRCTYWIGICLAESGQTQAALDQFQLVRNSSVHSDEALAAMFHSAELLQQQGHEEAAIATFRQVVQAIGDVAAYHNDYLSVDEIRKQLLAVYEQYLRAAKFDPAAQLSRLLHPLFPREGDLELQGDLLQAAAKSYFAKAEERRPIRRKFSRPRPAPICVRPDRRFSGWPSRTPHADRIPTNCGTLLNAFSKGTIINMPLSPWNCT